MHESEIKKAAVQILEEVFSSSQPASEIISAYTRSRRYIGSKDRRALTDMVWQAIRYHAHLCFKTDGFEKQIEILDTASQDTPDMPDWVRFECPEWLIPHIPHPEQELPALIAPAPTVLRANGNRERIQKILKDQGIETTLTSRSAYGLILEKRVNLNTVPAYIDGLIEVQDEGSQLIALETQVTANQSVLDLCAGAGGKSLILSQMMENKGSITAYDVSLRSLKELGKRAERAHRKNISITTTLPTTQFDTVVVDAPCSGTGTWRRAPDARWKLTPEQLTNIVQLQATILKTAASFVKKRLCYMTCSLTRDENEEQVQAFLKNYPKFTLVKEMRFSPYLTQTDGFYIAVLDVLT